MNRKTRPKGDNGERVVWRFIQSALLSLLCTVAGQNKCRANKAQILPIVMDWMFPQRWRCLSKHRFEDKRAWPAVSTIAAATGDVWDTALNTEEGRIGERKRKRGTK